MASYTIAVSERGAYAKTLVASTVDTVTIQRDTRSVEVTNLDGAAAIYFTVDGTTPTVAGASTYELPAVPSSREVPAPKVEDATVVKLISSGTPSYSVAAG